MVLPYYPSYPSSGAASSSHNTTTTTAGPRAKCDQVIYEALAKACEIIVGSRSYGAEQQRGLQAMVGTAAATAVHGGGGSGGSSSRFQLQVPEIASVRNILQAYRLTLHVPIRLDVYYQHPVQQQQQPPNNGGGDGAQAATEGRRELLERWCLEYAYSPEEAFWQSEGFTAAMAAHYQDPMVQLRHVCKRIVIWLRTLYCWTRLLPAQAMRPVLASSDRSSSRSNQSGSIGFSIYVNTNGGSSDEDVTSLLQQPHQSFQWQHPPAPVVTPYGSLSWKVVYATRPTVQRLVALQKSLTALPSSPQSLHPHPPLHGGTSYAVPQHTFHQQQQQQPRAQPIPIQSGSGSNNSSNNSSSHSKGDWEDGEDEVLYRLQPQPGVPHSAPAHFQMMGGGIGGLVWQQQQQGSAVGSRTTQQAENASWRRDSHPRSDVASQQQQQQQAWNAAAGAPTMHTYTEPARMEFRYHRSHSLEQEHPAHCPVTMNATRQQSQIAPPQWQNVPTPGSNVEPIRRRNTSTGDPNDEAQAAAAAATKDDRQKQISGAQRFPQGKPFGTSGDNADAAPERVLSGLSLALMMMEVADNNGSKETAPNGTKKSHGVEPTASEKRRAALHEVPPHMQQQPSSLSSAPPGSPKLLPSPTPTTIASMTPATPPLAATAQGEYGYAYNNYIPWQKIHPSSNPPVGSEGTTEKERTLTGYPYALSSSPSMGAFSAPVVGSWNNNYSCNPATFIPPRNTPTTSSPLPTSGPFLPSVNIAHGGYGTAGVGVPMTPPFQARPPGFWVQQAPPSPGAMLPPALVQSGTRSTQQPHQQQQDSDHFHDHAIMTSLDMLHSSPFQIQSQPLPGGGSGPYPQNTFVSSLTMGGGVNDSTNPFLLASADYPFKRSSLLFSGHPASGSVVSFLPQGSTGTTSFSTLAGVGGNHAHLYSSGQGENPYEEDGGGTGSGSYYDDMPFAVTDDDFQDGENDSRTDTKQGATGVDSVSAAGLGSVGLNTAGSSLLASQAALTSFAQKCAPHHHPRLKLFSSKASLSSSKIPPTLTNRDGLHEGKAPEMHGHGTGVTIPERDDDDPTTFQQAAAVSPEPTIQELADQLAEFRSYGASLLLPGPPSGATASTAS